MASCKPNPSIKKAYLFYVCDLTLMIYKTPAKTITALAIPAKLVRSMILELSAKKTRTCGSGE